LFSSFAPDVQHWPENETINPKLNWERINLSKHIYFSSTLGPSKRGQGMEESCLQSWAWTVPKFYKKVSADWNLYNHLKWDRHN
jgi:hypothetical protein